MLKIGSSLFVGMLYVEGTNRANASYIYKVTVLLILSSHHQDVSPL